jgi:mono/diheme cytochrome c family protein
MINQGLDEEEIADVMNYILNSWGNSSKVIITREKVASIKK